MFCSCLFSLDVKKKHLIHVSSKQQAVAVVPVKYKKIVLACEAYFWTSNISIYMYIYISMITTRKVSFFIGFASCVAIFFFLNRAKQELSFHCVMASDRLHDACGDLDNKSPPP